ncbi:hypothetical protein [Streptomyces flavofungini]|uniref:hypothetical protein n=1 Tax=Streptomyces flavofungini TaxID=68200 RepID=UPI00339D4E2D
MDNSVKDAEPVVAAAESAGAAADLGAAGLARFRRTADAGHGDKDMPPRTSWPGPARGGTRAHGPEGSLRRTPAP